MISEDQIGRSTKLHRNLILSQYEQGECDGRHQKQNKFIKSPSVNRYNSPDRKVRSFAADYPKGAPTNEAGLLTRDIEGRPLKVEGRTYSLAKPLVGRRVAGGTEEAFPATQSTFDAIAKEGTGRPAAMVAQSTIGRDVVGTTGIAKATG